MSVGDLVSVPVIHLLASPLVLTNGSLGSGGVLEISQESDAIALTPARLNVGSISLANQAYWAGVDDIATEDGVPFDVNGDGYADYPDGHGFCEGIWTTGPALDFNTFGQTGDNAPFYHGFINEFNLITQGGDQLITQSGDLLIGIDGIEEESDKYNTSATTGLSKQVDGYIIVMCLIASSFGPKPLAILKAEPKHYLIKPGNFVITKYDDDSTYTAAIRAVATLKQQLPDSEQTASR